MPSIAMLRRRVHALGVQGRKRWGRQPCWRGFSALRSRTSSCTAARRPGARVVGEAPNDSFASASTVCSGRRSSPSSTPPCAAHAPRLQRPSRWPFDHHHVVRQLAEHEQAHIVAAGRQVPALAHLARCVVLRVATSTKATWFARPRPTYIVLPSGDSASPTGVMSSGRMPESSKGWWPAPQSLVRWPHRLCSAQEDGALNVHGHHGASFRGDSRREFSSPR
jgi:hypothetical protein